MGTKVKHMEEAVELHRVLSGLVKDAELKNIKFFLGDNRNVSAKELCLQAMHSVAQIKFNQSTVIDNIDFGKASATLNDIL